MNDRKANLLEQINELEISAMPEDMNSYIGNPDSTMNRDPYRSV